MGIIFARFRRKPTTFEQLEKLEAQINTIQEYGRTTELTQKKVAGRFMLASVFVYVVTALIFYFYFLPKTLYEGIIHTLPLLAAPLVIISVKRILTWWYNRKLKRNRVKLTTLKDQKKKMLDKVMETETYKVAKEILEKFAPDEVVTRKSANTSFNSAYDTSLALAKPGAPGLRFRGTPEGRASLASVFDKPSTTLKARNSISSLAVASTPIRNEITQGFNPNLTMQTPRLPMPMARAILSRDRSALDKLVDYLVGDGPSNRYALICKQCSSHNGMALREEFEYLNFHCCYCHSFNPAKKQRPPAPKLGAARVTPPKALKSSDTSDSEKNSASDSESDAMAQTVQTIERTEEKQSTANDLNNIQRTGSCESLTEEENKCNQDEVERMEISDIEEKKIDQFHEKD